uniref:Uncharacterized protein n=1 Tax=Ixodes ricinus TaxID=34613 RepID=A0A6B0U5V2_IXORI
MLCTGSIVCTVWHTANCTTGHVAAEGDPGNDARSGVLSVGTPVEKGKIKVQILYIYKKYRAQKRIKTLRSNKKYTGIDKNR